MISIEHTQDSFCIGLTGGIGSGKSTVSKLFVEHGAGIIDTDVIAHHLTQAGGDAIAEIQDVFGNDYITEGNALDRTKMRKLIFSNNSAKQLLESILHPQILHQAKAQLKQLAEYPYIIIVVPLLNESPTFQQLVQRILVVDCPQDRQVDRVVQRNAMSAEEVRAIIAKQPTREARLRLANDVIYNDDGLDILTKQVAILHECYLNARKGI